MKKRTWRAWVRRRKSAKDSWKRSKMAQKQLERRTQHLLISTIAVGFLIIKGSHIFFMKTKLQLRVTYSMVDRSSILLNFFLLLKKRCNNRKWRWRRQVCIWVQRWMVWGSFLHNFADFSDALYVEKSLNFQRSELLLQTVEGTAFWYGVCFIFWWAWTTLANPVVGGA